MKFKTFKDQSRLLWHDDINQNTPTYEQIKIGCLQRIADATELMASNYLELQREVKYLREKRNMYQDWYYKSERRNAALRGVITKMKKKQS